MATKGERNVGLSLAGAGVGIIGVMILTGLFRAFPKGTPHTA
jgi:hypothetical protein